MTDIGYPPVLALEQTSIVAVVYRLKGQVYAQGAGIIPSPTREARNTMSEKSTTEGAVSYITVKEMPESERPRERLARVPQGDPIHKNNSQLVTGQRTA